MVKGTVTHFMLAVLSWWEISGVSPAFLGMRRGYRVQSRVKQGMGGTYHSHPIPNAALQCHIILRRSDYE